MLRSILPAVLCLSLLAACNEDSGGGQGGAVPASSNNNTPPVTTSGSGVTISGDQGASGANTSGQRLNPPHGEPGHICEIGVGEPLPDGNHGDVQILDAPPGLDVTTTIVSPPTGGSPTATMGGSGRINPPHGEPGHVCEIPVGEPLP
jgi:hypothetical protein